MSFGLGALVDRVQSAAVAGLPWPDGDPDGLDAAAGKLRAAATGLDGIASRLNGAAAGASGWGGQAAAAFRGAVGQEHAAMTGYAEALGTAAGAVRKLAGVVRTAQADVRSLAREVRTAEEEADRKEAVAATAGAAAATAEAAAAVADAFGSPALDRAASDASAAAGRASASASAARQHAIAVRARNTKRAQARCDEVERLDAATATAVDAATGKTPYRGVPFGAPTPATGFGRVALSGLSPDQWQEITYWRAGINRAHWDPSQGLLANDARVQAVYRYYGNLFLENQNEFQWAGMANLVGPMFYGGWQDLYVARHLTSDGERAQYLSELVGLPKLPGVAYDAADAFGLPLNQIGNLGAKELEWYEDRFLTMQKKIFDDLAWQHEAYAMGGIGLMRDLSQQNVLPREALGAWENIARGSPDSIAQGNEDLLYREQTRIIQPDYDAMRDHNGPSGQAFTYASGVLAENPMPGGHAYRDFDPVHFDPSLPTPPIGVPGFSYDPPDVSLGHYTLPLPAGNLSHFSDRWDWITKDMLPAYRDFLHHPDAVRSMVQSDVAGRAHDFRKMPDFPYPGG